MGHPSKTELHVLHVTDVDTPNYYLNNLAQRLRPEGIRLSALTFRPDKGFLAELALHGAEGTALDLTKPSQHLRAWPAMIREIRRLRPDIVHAHLFWPSFVAVTSARALGVRTVATRHHSDAVFRIKNPVKRALYLAVEQMTNRLSGHIIAPSRMVEGILREREGVPAEKVSLIPYPQDVERFRRIPEAEKLAAAALYDSRHRPALVCVSRLFREKGHRFLFLALASLKQKGFRFSLYLVGTGDNQAELKQRLAELGLQHEVCFLGWRNDALALIAKADLFVHPSLHEALPSAVIEAMALAKPIVATDVSGVRDIVDEYGEIVPPADPQSLEAAIERSLRELESARNRARAGAERLLAKMDADVVAKQYETLYRRLAAGAEC